MAIREVDLGSVIGPAGPQGPKGDTPDISNKQDIINISGILKGTLNGQITAAAPGVDYPSVEQLAAKQDEIHVVGLLKGDGNSVTAAVAGTDYATAQQLNTKQSRITATGILKGDGNGGVTTAAANTDYATTRLATAAYSGLMGTAQFTKLNVIDDYIVDHGSSTSGGTWKWRKWNSGFQELWGLVTQSVSATSLTYGRIYATSGAQINFPITLSSANPFIQLTSDGPRYANVSKGYISASSVTPYYTFFDSYSGNVTVTIYVCA